MKAVRFHAAKDIRVEDVPKPSKKLGPRDVLIKPIVCGICGDDASRDRPMNTSTPTTVRDETTYQSGFNNELATEVRIARRANVAKASVGAK